jgi:hypothetical protein
MELDIDDYYRDKDMLMKLLAEEVSAHDSRLSSHRQAPPLKPVCIYAYELLHTSDSTNPLNVLPASSIESSSRVHDVDIETTIGHSVSFLRTRYMTGSLSSTS